MNIKLNLKTLSASHIIMHNKPGERERASTREELQRRKRLGAPLRSPWRRSRLARKRARLVGLLMRGRSRY